MKRRLQRRLTIWNFLNIQKDSDTIADQEKNDYERKILRLVRSNVIIILCFNFLQQIFWTKENNEAYSKMIIVFWVLWSIQVMVLMYSFLKDKLYVINPILLTLLTRGIVGLYIYKDKR